MGEKVGIEIKASKRYREDFVREVEEGIRDILEGRLVSMEELYEKYGIKPKEARLELLINVFSMPNRYQVTVLAGGSTT